METTAIRRKIRIAFCFGHPGILYHHLFLLFFLLFFRYFQQVLSRFQDGNLIRFTRLWTLTRLWAVLLCQILTITLVGRLHRLDRVYLKLLLRLKNRGSDLISGLGLPLRRDLVQGHRMQPHATHTVETVRHRFLIVLVDGFDGLRDGLAHRCVGRCSLDSCFVLLLVEQSVVSIYLCEFLVFVPPS